MRRYAMPAIVLLASALAACSRAPMPSATVNDEFDPYAVVALGPVSYTTPHGVRVDRLSRGEVRHSFTANPAIAARVRFDANPPSDLKIDAERLGREFQSTLDGGPVLSTQHAFRGTAETVKMQVRGADSEGAPTHGTLIVLRKDNSTVAVSATGPADQSADVDSAAERLADTISFTPDGTPAKRSSAMADEAESIRSEQEAAAAKEVLGETPLNPRR
ncbi:MAG: hypothetical protein SF028_04565 [Candidatus Sumerlaeia bacterium]|nr:hypothetical protein [Candidatus Sumerlaeia bacterium]